MLEKAKKNLKVISYVIIILAIMQVIVDGITIFLEKDILKETLSGAGFPQEIIPSLSVALPAILGVFIGLSLILYLYLGFCGISFAKGTYKGKAYMPWLTFALVIEILAVIVILVDTATNGTLSGDGLSDLLNQITSACFIIAAWLAARQIKKAQ